ncbi:MAG: ATP-binding protein [Terriglobales bacterium]
MLDRQGSYAQNGNYSSRLEAVAPGPVAMTDNTHAAREMSSLAHRLATEYAVSRILAEGGDAAESLARALAVVGRELGWDYCVCWRLQPATDTMHLLASWQCDPHRLHELETAMRAFTLRPSHGLAGRVWRAGEAEAIDDAGLSGRFFLTEEARRAGLGPAICVPIPFRGSIIGLLQCLGARGSAPNAATQTVLTSLAEQIGRFFDHTSMEGALRASEAHFRSLFDANIAGVHCSTLDGKALAVNAAFVQMFGFASSAEALACNSTEFYVDPVEREGLLQHLRLHGRDVNRHLRLRHQDGRILWVLANTVLIPGQDGAPDSNETTLIDVTEVREFEERQRQTAKLESMGQLAGGLAHDFNNLLTVINGYADLAMSRMGGEDPNREAMTKLLNAGERAAALTQQLLAFGRRQASEPELLDLEAVVRSTTDLLAPALGKNIQLHIEAQPDLGRIRADGGQIGQIVTNLALNARDAMANGGDLLLELQNVEVGPAYIRSHVQSQPGSYVRLAVSDNGEGMDEDTKLHAFEPLFTTKATGKGTGLGLASVYGLVMQHNGWIELYSERGHGTTFKIYFPQAQSLASAVDVGTARRLEAGHGETLLVMEDKPDMRTLLEDVLAGQGYKVELSATAAEAKAILARRHTTPDLLITDLVMAMGSGLELAAQLSGVPVIFLSGCSRSAAILQGLLSAGHDGAAFLQKPFAPAALVETVAAELRKRAPAGTLT